MTQNHLQHILLWSNCALLLFQITVFWTSLLLSNVSFFWKPADRNLNRDMQRSFEMSGWCPSPIVLCSVSNGLILRWKVHRSPPEMEEEKKTVLLLRLRRLKPHSTKQPERSGRGRDTNQHWNTHRKTVTHVSHLVSPWSVMSPGAFIMWQKRSTWCDITAQGVVSTCTKMTSSSCVLLKMINMS